MRFLRFTLLLGAVQLIVLLAIELLIFRNLDLRLVRFAQMVAVPQFEALVLCVAVPQRRSSESSARWSSIDAGWVLVTVAAAAFTLLAPASRIVLPAVALLIAAAFFVTVRCVVRIVLGLLLIAAATDLLHPWISWKADVWFPRHDILFQDLATYGLGTVALILMLGALERLLSPEFGTAYRSLLVAIGAAVITIDVVLFNYFSHPYLSPASAVIAGICGVFFSVSLATTALLLRLQPRTAR